MDKFLILTQCEDKTCCCLPLRTSSVLISVIGLFSCLLDAMSESNLGRSCILREHVNSLKVVLLALFQMANMLLLIGSIIENALLLQIYLWYTLGFILIGFMVNILEFCFHTKDKGVWSFATFIPEVVFLFALFQCMSLVDTYKKHLGKV